MEKGSVTFRKDVHPGDAAAVREIVSSSGFFYPDEVETAVELVEERLKGGEASGYFFLFAEASGGVAGYACFGPIPCTGSSYDLYWIALEQTLRGQGIGGEILRRCEGMLRKMGATRIYVETSSRAQYESTRHFYEKYGYSKEARLKDFYYPGDDKIIYLKAL